MGAWGMLSIVLAVTGGAGDAARGAVVDTWVYVKTGDAVSTVYNGRPIRHVVADGNDGGFDRPIRTKPDERYVFVDTRLSLEDADTIRLFWLGLDPRTPTEYIAFSADRAYVLPDRYFREGEPPAAELREARSHLGDRSTRSTPSSQLLSKGGIGIIRTLRVHLSRAATRG